MNSKEVYSREIVDEKTMSALINALDNWDRSNNSEFHIFNEFLNKINKMGLNSLKKDDHYSTFSVPKEKAEEFIKLNEFNIDHATGEILSKQKEVWGLCI